MLSKLKSFVCIVILLLAIVAISYGTYYTLTNKGIRENVDLGIKSKLELVNSNKTKNVLAENYNVYLGNQKHKMKLEYNVGIQEGLANIILVVYLDGKEIFNENVASDIEAEDIDAVFDEVNVNNYVRLNLNNIKTIEKDEVEYLVLKIGYFTECFKEKYYVYTGEGESLIKEGLIARNDDIHYIGINGEKLGFFYNTEEQIMAKIHNNDLYALVPKNDKDEISILEYKYEIKDGEIKESLLNTYNELKIDDTTKEE